MAILGIDEVGRGPWAGPLVVGAVILPDPKPDWTQSLRDSKKLTPKKRKELIEKNYIYWLKTYENNVVKNKYINVIEDVSNGNY